MLHKAQFQFGAAELAQLPPDQGWEVAFAGRSNAGKSSAINALTNRRRLAFVSKTPGRTQQINYFDLGSGRSLVDLPGYGYAQVPGALRRQWDVMLGAYLQRRASLRGLVAIMDIRHPLTPLDRALLDWVAPTQKPVLVLLTKADKLTRQAADAQLRLVREALASDYPQVRCELFSSVSHQGVEMARAFVEALLLDTARKSAGAGYNLSGSPRKSPGTVKRPGTSKRPGAGKGAGTRKSAGTKKSPRLKG